MVKVLTAKVSLMRRHWSPWKARLGAALLAAWPLTRWMALALAARLSGNSVWHARADEWASIFRRRNVWLAGYPSARRHEAHCADAAAAPSEAIAAAHTLQVRDDRPDVSVIIPHLDDTTRLAKCIDALRRQTLPAARTEIVVCDNGSACGMADVWLAAKGATVVATEEKGAGPARNAAVAASRGKALAFIDSDCVPDSRWLERGLAALASSDLAGGQVDVGTAIAGHPTATEAFEKVFAFDNAHYVTALGFSVTANLFARRDVFDAIGGFRNGVPEDMDWCRRAREAGFRLGYAPDAIVTHPARENFAALARKWRRLTDEAFADWQGEGRSRAAWLLRAAAVLASPAIHAGRIFTSRALTRWQDRAAAAGVLIRIRTLRAWWMARQAIGTGPTSTATPAVSSAELRSS